MRKFAIYLLPVLLVGACQWHKSPKDSLKQDPQPVAEEKTPVPPVAPITSEALTTPLMQQTPTPVESQTATAHEQTPVPQNQTTSIEPVAAAEVPAEKVVPAPDQPVFKGEELINMTGRLLPPYAALVPNTDAPQPVPWAYEQLKYGIYYGFIKAGTSYIRNRGLVDINGHAAYFIQTSAFSASVIDAVFKVRDINYSWLDATHFYSYGYGQSVREGNYRRDEWLEFDYPAKKYVGQIQKKKEPKTISGPLDIHVSDMLGALYYVRAQKLEVGNDIIFDIINREKQYPLLVKVLKKETVKISAGKFNCVLVEPQLRGEGIFVSKGKSLKVWLTDDEHKMPVKMSVEVFIGSVSAELLEYKRQVPANIL